MFNWFKETGKIRTDMNCTACGKVFIAELDYDIDGQHVVECPYCGHEHCRIIKGGIITGDRWDSRSTAPRVDVRRIWKHDVLQMKTTVACEFLREKWLHLGLH